jgi:hypothetical protein
MGFGGRVARQFGRRRAALTPLKSPTGRWNVGPGVGSGYLAGVREWWAPQSPRSLTGSGDGLESFVRLDSRTGRRGVDRGIG